ncbi:uncharacterized protein SCHCODRAFT_01209352 [Schizophyllum commune H4-8]|uniref:uncharacterized protein n=1 Tax=Schizophyllum commune (strain H4-8 / FGSC 9210) TaxID=578458 RepID=UPI00215DE9D1|nr:uncharacterized protein SCHCODRAFT_01209352 [Schizophyllum commune H4-8]KAI5897642.1 hypothetical protein SCHCODRAFT_01209352 [Schizophyllum commune H4-8]
MDESASKRRASSVPAPRSKRKLSLVLDYVEVPPLPARKRQKYEAAASVEPRQTRSRTEKSPARAAKNNGATGRVSTPSKAASRNVEKDVQRPPPKRGRRASVSGPAPNTRLAQLDIAPKPKCLPPRSRFQSVSPLDKQPSLCAASSLQGAVETISPDTAEGAQSDQEREQNASDNLESRGSRFSPESTSAAAEQQEPAIHEDEGIETTNQPSMTSPRISLAAQIDLTPTQDTSLTEDDERLCGTSAGPDPDGAPPPTDQEIARLPPPPVLPPTPPASSHAEYPRTQPPAPASLAPIPMNPAVAQYPSIAHIPRVPLPPPLEEYVPSRPSKAKTRTPARPLQKAKTESSLDSVHLNDFALDFAMLLPEYDGFLTSGARHIIHHMHHTLALESIARRRLEDQLSTEISLRCAVEREAERLRAELAELQEEAEERRARKQARRERRAAGIAASQRSEATSEG